MTMMVSADGLSARLTIGGVSVGDLVSQIREVGCYFDNPTSAILNLKQAVFVVDPEPRELFLRRAQVGDLGFTEKPRTSDLFNVDKLSILNLGLCPPVAALHLLLAFRDQPRKSKKRVEFFIAMEPIVSPWSSYGYKAVFRVGWTSDGKRHIGVRHCRPNDRWDLKHELVFCERN